MNDKEQVPEAGIPAAPADAGETPLETLERLGVRGILRQLARDGQLIELRCEMPQCYCFRGRSHFESRSTGSDWEPTADHYPRLKAHKGHLTPDNVRLARRLCNRRDYTWRMKINAMLAKRMSLEQIAEQLNAEKVPTIHGTNRWTAASVRRHSFRRSCPRAGHRRCGALRASAAVREWRHFPPRPGAAGVRIVVRRDGRRSAFVGSGVVAALLPSLRRAGRSG